MKVRTRCARCEMDTVCMPYEVWLCSECLAEVKVNRLESAGGSTFTSGSSTLSLSVPSASVINRTHVFINDMDLQAADVLRRFRKLREEESQHG